MMYFAFKPGVNNYKSSLKLLQTLIKFLLFIPLCTFLTGLLLSTHYQFIPLSIILIQSLIAFVPAAILYAIESFCCTFGCQDNKETVSINQSKLSVLCLHEAKYSCGNSLINLAINPLRAATYSSLLATVIYNENFFEIHKDYKNNLQLSYGIGFGVGAVLGLSNFLLTTFVNSYCYKKSFFLMEPKVTLTPIFVKQKFTEVIELTTAQQEYDHEFDTTIHHHPFLNLD